MSQGSQVIMVLELFVVAGAGVVTGFLVFIILDLRQRLHSQSERVEAWVNAAKALLEQVEELKDRVEVVEEEVQGSSFIYKPTEEDD